ncbi:hypothetical protein C8F01DRAFT_178018 [Mycena amicta]|nr:hypothetical protein C8F01DRAFT_178018 [Mycena amicta]
MTLPQELLDAIVDEVDEVNSLRACALASRRFLFSSQPRIFSVAQLLPTYNNTSPVTRLAQVFDASPHLALHVRELEVDLAYWTSESTSALETILRLVTKLQRLAVYGCGEDDHESLWTGLTRQLIDCLERPNLICVRFTSLNFLPNAVLRAAVALPEVTLDGCDHYHRNSVLDHLQEQLRPNRLRDLTLTTGKEHTARPFLRLLCELGGYPTGLKRLVIGGHRYYWCHRKLVEMWGQSLESFTMPIPRSAFEIPHLPLVRDFQFSMGYHLEVIPNAVAKISRAFPNLETLTLYFSVDGWGLEYELQRSLAIGPTPSFDAAVFPVRQELLHLKSILCKLRVSYLSRLTSEERDTIDIPQHFERFKAAVESTMPGPIAAGMLQFSLEESEEG